MKRYILRSINSAGFNFTVPATWLRIPTSANSGTNSIPDLPSFNEANTSSLLLPILEIIPKPVITTLFIFYPLSAWKYNKSFKLSTKLYKSQKNLLILHNFMLSLNHFRELIM